MSFADLFRSNFAYCNLARANFSQSDLKGTRFRGAKLTEADITEPTCGPIIICKEIPMTRVPIFPMPGLIGQICTMQI